jgi:hypothetical protein
MTNLLNAIVYRTKQKSEESNERLSFEPVEFTRGLLHSLPANGSIPIRSSLIVGNTGATPKADHIPVWNRSTIFPYRSHACPGHGILDHGAAVLPSIFFYTAVVYRVAVEDDVCNRYRNMLY